MCPLVGPLDERHRRHVLAVGSPAVRECVISSCSARGTERRAFRMGSLHVIGMVCAAHVTTP